MYTQTRVKISVRGSLCRFGAFCLIALATINQGEGRNLIDARHLHYNIETLGCVSESEQFVSCDELAHLPTQLGKIV